MENPQEIPAIVELVDRMTGGVIYNMNYIALDNPTYLRSNGLFDVSVIDLDNTREDGAHWNLDKTSETLEDLSKHSFLLIDYACLMHLKLIKDKKVIVVSKNGISPYVICAFYLLRGVQYEKVGLKYIFTFLFDSFVNLVNIFFLLLQNNV